MGHCTVAVQTHGCEGEDGSVHREEVQAQEEAAAQFSKSPARRQAVVHNEGGGEKVEKVGESEAQHLEVERGGGEGGRRVGRGGRGGGVGEAGWHRYPDMAAGQSSSTSPPAPPALQKEAQSVQIPCDAQQRKEGEKGAEESCGCQAG